MKIVVLSSAPLIASSGNWEAYSPYAKEMEIWAKFAEQITFCCPIWKANRGLLATPLKFEIEKPIELLDFQATSFRKMLHSFYAAFINIITIFKAMKAAEHIHLRCPGNIGLLGCFVQILFPNKPKTAKYAGNWDPNAKQPWSYKLQKWILSNTVLTKNMQVLVYGEWPNQSKNIKPFFTATYREIDKQPIVNRSLNDVIELLFIGTLSVGKRPMYAVQLAEAIRQKDYKIRLRFYGEGTERKHLEDYISSHNLASSVFLMGNKTKEEVQLAYQQSHFLVLPSKSEGWPKAVAEAMFWGCVPVVSAVSCVPTMLDNESRGVLLTMNLESDAKKISAMIDGTLEYHGKSERAMNWSRQYTLEKFESEIQKLLQ